MPKCQTFLGPPTTLFPLFCHFFAKGVSSFALMIDEAHQMIASQYNIWLDRVNFPDSNSCRIRVKFVSTRGDQVSLEKSDSSVWNYQPYTLIAAINNNRWKSRWDTKVLLEGNKAEISLSPGSGMDADYSAESNVGIKKVAMDPLCDIIVWGGDTSWKYSAITNFECNVGVYWQCILYVNRLLRRKGGKE